MRILAIIINLVTGCIISVIRPSVLIRERSDRFVRLRFLFSQEENIWIHFLKFVYKILSCLLIISVSWQHTAQPKIFRIRNFLKFLVSPYELDHNYIFIVPSICHPDVCYIIGVNQCRFGLPTHIFTIFTVYTSYCLEPRKRDHWCYNSKARGQVAKSIRCGVLCNHVITSFETIIDALLIK